MNALVGSMSSSHTRIKGSEESQTSLTVPESPTEQERT
jgi:hypothetical protein